MGIVWTPFCAVHSCTGGHRSNPRMRLFAVTRSRHGAADMFAVDSETERQHWVASISEAVRALTRSLFPSCDFSVYPRCGTGGADNKLLASQLIIHVSDSKLALVYCELC